MKPNERRLLKLSQQLRDARSLLILTHDNPDPDALASGWALRAIARGRLGLRADLAYGGIIGRAENRAMLRLLRIPAVHLSRVCRRLDRYDAIALIDTQPRTGNNSLPPERQPTIVIDHHPLRRATRGAPYHDVRAGFGACATILNEYLAAARLEHDRRLATALFYAIRSETQNLGREATEADGRAFVTLFPWVRNRVIAQIEQAPLSRHYLALLDRAFRATRIYGTLAITELREIPYPDVPAELADLILRVDDVRWSFVTGAYRGRLHLSIRTSDRRTNAGRLLQRIVGDHGRAGGHGMMAGGRIELDGGGVSAAGIQRQLARRLRRALRVGAQRGEPLLGRTRRKRDG